MKQEWDLLVLHTLSLIFAFHVVRSVYEPLKMIIFVDIISYHTVRLKYLRSFINLTFSTFCLISSKWVNELNFCYIYVETTTFVIFTACFFLTVDLLSYINTLS